MLTHSLAAQGGPKAVFRFILRRARLQDFFRMALPKAGEFNEFHPLLSLRLWIQLASATGGLIPEHS